MTNLKALKGILSKASPFATPLKLMYQRIESKHDANDSYDNMIMPLLHNALMRGCRFESDDIQILVKALKELAPVGARRNNFERMYLKDEYTLRKLPRYAKDLPYGYWY